MRTPFLPLAICIAALLGTTANAEVVTLTIGGPATTRTVRQAVASNQVVNIKSYLDLYFPGGVLPGTPTNASQLVVEKNNASFVVSAGILPQASDRDLVVAGPALLTLRYPFSRSTNYSALVTLDIKSTETAVPTAAVVIPSDAAGNVEICLESSTDMVNWAPAQPGTYGTTAEKRFFRVRALRQ
jgi:hypothetical protein